MARSTDAAERGGVSSARIVVDAERVGHRVRPQGLGVNHHYNRNGYGLWDPAAGRPEPAVVAGVRRAGIQSVRYPGGTVANLFDWKQAIGPQRGCQVDGNGERATGFLPVRGGQEWGPDEYMTFTEATDAEPFIMMPFVTETPGDAASWVEYMNSPSGTAANPGRGIDWAEVRARNGHPRPYGVTRWEIGNEQHHAGSRYWMSADDPTAVRQYAFGGHRDVVGEPMGADCAHPVGGVPSDGAAGQVFSVLYPPVARGSLRLRIGEHRWHQVRNLADAGPHERAYVLSPATGRVRFGDGVHGAAPARGATPRASYRSVHQGFFAFARQMKAVDPSLDVCASWGRTAFVNLVGTRQYDCLTTHAITSFEASGNDDWADPLEGHDRQVLAVANKRASVAELQRAMPAGTPLWLTEFCYINGDLVDFPMWPASMSNAVATASLWKSWLELGIPWAMGEDLIWGFQRAVLGPAPDFTFTASATTRQGIAPMFEAGGRLLRATVPLNPVRDPDVGRDTYAGLSVAATRDRSGDLWLLVINRLPYRTASARVAIRGATITRRAVVRRVTSPDFASWNAPGSPPVVRLTTNTRPVRNTGFRHRFAPHSVTVFRLPTR